ncbi:MAG: hypothetical protein M3066_21140 [Actinomycetota bacterium]|nr:hypothetical protein [Actinomycetota bacterium]
MACEDCGEPDTNAVLGGVEVCDRCFDRRISAHTGLLRLPDPPPPIAISGPDGRRHLLRYRVWRAGVGIEVQLDETGVPVGGGYRFAVLGDNDAELDTLVAEVRAMAETEIARQYLERTAERHPWTVGDDGEVAGRFAWSTGRGNEEPYNVVVDGRTISWEDMARALEPYDGWGFRLVIEDRVRDLRSDAEIIELRSPGAGPADG